MNRSKPYSDVSPALAKRGSDAKKRLPPGSALRAIVTNPEALHALRAKLVGWQRQHQAATTLYNGRTITCTIKPGATNSDGYQQMCLGQLDGKQQTGYYHHVIAWASFGDDAILSSWRDSISHLCHHPDCINPSHLVKEPMWKNVRRQACAGPEACECDETHKCLLPSPLADN